MNTASILPFAQPSARTSPQPDIASVEVKHTARGCESGADVFCGSLIRVLSKAYVRALMADDRAGKVDLWESLCAANASRSPDAVARMERARGLR